MTPEERAADVMRKMGSYGVTETQIVQAIREAIAEEREACAKIADQEHEDPGDGPDAALTRVAAAIRARGLPPRQE